ncbi:hypothetical protein [Gulosibacter sp. 10]|uniref:hypothetical protein n=1 Tax=Gulosibacter sp. 10 TaxID=1255570 RepID=UPI00097F5045|nr:hypothetical protein [Gulosibacter sp. 10]SJM58307.1 hypothetical protein FM112_05810 [Gulosibacter sp. 10]
MTETNGAKDDSLSAAGETREPNAEHAAAVGAADPRPEDDAAVPAAGGTFGVDSDHSGYGEGRSLPGDEQDDLIDVGSSDDEMPPLPNVPADGAVPAHGGTFGVTHDQSGYRAAAGQPGAAPFEQQPAYGTPQPAQYGGFAPPAGTPEMVPPQYGGTSTAQQGRDTLALLALFLGVVGAGCMLIPNWAWMVGGVLGLIGVVLGAMRLNGSSRFLALLGVIAGGVAVLIAIATAVVVYLV